METKSKNRKKIMAVLALTLAVACVAGGVLAKYVTSSTGGDSARVAYWGFDQDATIDLQLFDGAYDNVQSSNTDNVIAPGTSKTTSFAFGYTPKSDTVNALTAGAIAAPEVAYTFAVDVDMAGDYDALDANENFHWTLQKGAEAAAEYATVDELLAALKALSGDASGSKVYQPGELPSAFTAADEIYTIGWEWEFSADEDGDAADTLMGNAQDLDDVTFSITVSATQMD